MLIRYVNDIATNGGIYIWTMDGKHILRFLVDINNSPKFSNFVF